MISKKNIKGIIIRFLNGEMTSVERKELEVWINLDKKNLRYFKEIKALYQAAHKELNKIAQTDEEWNRFEERIKKANRKAKRNFIRIFEKIAAVLILPLIAGGFFYITRSHAAIDVYKNGKFVVISPAGQKSQIILSDSTHVWLNSGSKLTYTAFNDHSFRKVFLEGEGFFDVAKKHKYPFVVSTKDFDVKVTGTKFNVRSYSEENINETILEEGKVIVNFHNGQKYKLLPGQMISTKKNGKTKISKVNVKDLVCWKNNILKINNTPFKEIVPMLERWYGVHIVIPDMDKFEDKRFTMTIKTESLQEVLKLMKYITPMKYTINGSDVEIDFLDT